jgi:hypothetical protein
MGAVGAVGAGEATGGATGVAETCVAATGTCSDVGSTTFLGSGGVPPIGALSKVGITLPLTAAVLPLTTLPLKTLPFAFGL